MGVCRSLMISVFLDSCIDTEIQDTCQFSMPARSKCSTKRRPGFKVSFTHSLIGRLKVFTASLSPGAADSPNLQREQPKRSMCAEPSIRRSKFRTQDATSFKLVGTRK